MSFNLSECENFLEFDELKFMAFEETSGPPCDGCYFLNGEECEWYGNYNTDIMAAICSVAMRSDQRNIIWMRIE